MYRDNTQRKYNYYPEYQQESAAKAQPTQAPRYNPLQADYYSSKWQQQANRLQAKEVDLKAAFWTVLVCLIAIPLLNSSVVNIAQLCTNLGTNFQLRQERARLKKSTNKLEKKIKQVKSPSGIKKSIKEEIKLIDENEILIKII